LRTAPPPEDDAPDNPNLFFIGLFQPIGCMWRLADCQARIAALQISGRLRRRPTSTDSSATKSPTHTAGSSGRPGTQLRSTTVLSGANSSANSPRPDPKHDAGPSWRWKTMSQLVGVRSRHLILAGNSTVLKGDVATEVANLKQPAVGDIVVYASGQLVPTLMRHDLVDEMRVMIYPFVVGAGNRLFNEASDKKPLRLVDAQNDQVVSLR
jgi:hypothetical protein